MNTIYDFNHQYNKINRTIFDSGYISLSFQLFFYLLEAECLPAGTITCYKNTSTCIRAMYQTAQRQLSTTASNPT